MALLTQLRSFSGPLSNVQCVPYKIIAQLVRTRSSPVLAARHPRCVRRCRCHMLDCGAVFCFFIWSFFVVVSQKRLCIIGDVCIVAHVPDGVSKSV